MDRTDRATIRHLRQRGYRVLFQCNADGTIALMAISPAGQAYIVRGRVCDDSRAVVELGRMVGMNQKRGSPVHKTL
jgi:hypothetical protein